MFRTSIRAVCLCLFFLLCGSSSVFAADQAHITTIINQVRGTECCSAGGLNELHDQLDALKANRLPATFALRFDVLSNRPMVDVLKNAKGNGHELAAFLEITPELAKESGVVYRGSSEQWYEAQNAFLVGYSPSDRQKILDTYFAQFQKVFGFTPTTTVAWMIDAPSLQYLSEKYHVTVHELTREQWGTDSYTLYGGPPYLPYHPSTHWPIIPSTENLDTPLIVRQTITDPVWNYGDTTNSRTSQPNDYALKERGFPYFSHLFDQAHSQPQTPYTFALLGLENSMPEVDQQEFSKQLQAIALWQKNGPNRHVLTAAQFGEWEHQQNPAKIIISQGQDEKDSNSRAWWVTTTKYRLRLRLDNNALYASDIRLYDQQWSDPYTSTTSSRLAYWVVPFVLDGSRYFQDDTTGDFQVLAPDNLSDRTKFSPPTRLEISTNTSPDQLTWTTEGESTTLRSNTTILARFTPENFSLSRGAKLFQSNPFLTNTLQNLFWKSRSGQTLWGVKTESDGDLTRYLPQVNITDLTAEREEHYPLLFPEVRERPVDPAQSSLLKNNQYAQAGRNPVRLVFFPRDQYGYPTLTYDEPQVATLSGSFDRWSFEKPHGSNGMVFVDFYRDEPGTATIQLSVNHFSQTLSIYFAPDCRHQIKWCLTHPQQIPWYVQNWIGDRWRAWQEKHQ